MIPRQLLSYPEQLAKRLSDMEREIDKLKRELRNYHPTEGGGSGPSVEVNDGLLTLQRNGTTLGGFSANQATNTTLNIQVPTKTSDITNDSGYITNAAIPTNISAFNNDVGYLTSVSWGDVSGKPSFALVATTGDYNDLQNLPTIPVVPTNVSAFTNDAGYLTSVDWTDILNKPPFATVASTGDYNDLLNTPVIPPGVILYNSTGYNTDGAMTQKATTDALDLKADTSSLSLVATTGDYGDLSNTPSLALVATSGSYNDLSNKPTIPTVNNATLTLQLDGSNVNTFTANASSNVTANFVPRKLNNRFTSRPTSANLTTLGDGSLTKFVATSSMTTGKPPADAHIIHMCWDNTGGYDNQLALLNGQSGRVLARGQNAGSWGNWVELARGAVEITSDTGRLDIGNWHFWYYTWSNSSAGWQSKDITLPSGFNTQGRVKHCTAIGLWGNSGDNRLGAWIQMSATTLRIRYYQASSGSNGWSMIVFGTW